MQYSPVRLDQDMKIFEGFKLMNHKLMMTNEIDFLIPTVDDKFATKSINDFFERFHKHFERTKPTFDRDDISSYYMNLKEYTKEYTKKKKPYATTLNFYAEEGLSFLSILHLYNDMLDNEDIPSLITFTPDETVRLEYYHKGKLHRTFGPAIVEYSLIDYTIDEDSEEYYLDGIQYEKEESDCPSESYDNRSAAEKILDMLRNQE